MARKLTVSQQWLHLAADQLVNEAEQSLKAWIILGQAERYCQNLGKAAMLRRAAEITSISQRREFLRNNGVEA